MVGHDAIGEQSHRLPLDGLAQHAEEGVVVAIVLEDGGTGVGPVQGVVDKAAFGGAERSSRTSE